MKTFPDFVMWCGSQKEAAAKTGYSEATICRAVKYGRVSVKLAERVDELTNGLFRKADMLWPER